MGIFIIRSFMDEVGYVAGRPNVLTLVKRWPVAEETDDPKRLRRPERGARGGSQMPPPFSLPGSRAVPLLLPTPIARVPRAELKRGGGFVETERGGWRPDREGISENATLLECGVVRPSGGDPSRSPRSS